MTRATRPLRLVGLGAVGLAALLSLAGVPITSAQGQTIFAHRVDGALPVDSPYDPVWQDVRPVVVVLSGQPVVPPMRLEPAFPSVRVRALANGDRIAILLEWDDPTRDESVLAVESFADAAAVQLALGDGTSICMGQQAGGLNIWHWKADWAVDLAQRQDVEDVHPGMPDDVHAPVDDSDDALGPDGFLTGDAAGNPRSAAIRPSSVEDLNAVGFGSLTPQTPAGQNVHGASEHRDGVWRVVMSRALSDGDPNDATLRPGDAAAVIAFAVWDGSRGDRDGQKSVSSWLALSLARPPIGFIDMWPYFFLLVMALGLSGFILWIGARQPDIGLGWPHGRPGGRPGR
ncbi:MAG: ethylbenzene dehydrogenase-related protein [Chloroflexota bacterium]